MTFVRSLEQLPSSEARAFHDEALRHLARAHLELRRYIASISAMKLCVESVDDLSCIGEMVSVRFETFCRNQEEICKAALRCEIVGRESKVPVSSYGKCDIIQRGN